jgi:hypothetical protein
MACYDRKALPGMVSIAFYPVRRRPAPGIARFVVQNGVLLGDLIVSRYRTEPVSARFADPFPEI